MTQPIAPPDALNLGLGRNIRRARLATGISMRALASRCGVAQSFLSEVERGLAMPSIATLYRIADALGVASATLLPAHQPGDVHVVRADEGQQVASSERPGSAVGRVVFSDEAKGLEVYEYAIAPDDDLDVWYQHDGDKVLFVLEGRLVVEFDGHPAQHLGPGDCIVHTALMAHRWQVEGDAPMRLLLVITRPTP